MDILLDLYKKQKGELVVLVDRHLAHSQDITRRVLTNSERIAEARHMLEQAKALQDNFDRNREALRKALDAIESGPRGSFIAEANLSEWRGLVADEKALPVYSLCRIGCMSDPEALLAELDSPDEIKELRSYLSRPVFERIKWTKGDYLVCGVCVLVGLALELLDLAWRENSPIDRSGTLRQWFNEHLHHHPDDSPIDYQGPGFGGDLHRGRSRGHDLARFLEAVDQTARGQFAGTRWSYGKPIEVIRAANQFGSAYPPMAWTAAFANVVTHLFADFFSTHSLPLPLTTVVYDHAGRELRKFTQRLYQGGFNLRHVALGGTEVLLSFLAIEVWLWLQHGADLRKSDLVSLKRYEMRTAVTGMLSGLNIAGAVLFQNPFFLNIPMLIATVDSATRWFSLRAKQRRWVYREMRNLDELTAEWNRLAMAISSGNDALPVI